MKLHFDEQIGQIRDETVFPIAYVDRLAHERFPDLARQMAAGPELLAACHRQHEAIDMLTVLCSSRHQPKRKPRLDRSSLRWRGE